MTPWITILHSRNYITSLTALLLRDKTIETIDAIRQFREVVNERHFGSASEVLDRMKESFGENEAIIPLQPDWQVEIGIFPDTTMADSFLVVFWRVTKPEGGSLNLPYIFQKRSLNGFEITMPT